MSASSSTIVVLAAAPLLQRAMITAGRRAVLLPLPIAHVGRYLATYTARMAEVPA